MSQSGNSKAKDNREARNQSQRSPKESKLNRRSVTFSRAEQAKLLKYYRDKGWATGRGGR